MVADPTRGPPLELALAKVLRCCQPKDIQLLGMSATLGGAHLPCPAPVEVLPGGAAECMAPTSRCGLADKLTNVQFSVLRTKESDVESKCMHVLVLFNV